MKIKLLLVWLLLAGGTLHTGYAQQRNDSFFKNGDKVNLIGNSITHSGDYHHYVLMYYATRFPAEKVTFYNSGIKGDNANSFLRRMDNDILPRKANWSVVMAGMNDVNRGLYSAERQGDADITARKERALKDYAGYLETVVQRLEKSKTKIILQKPSIYDQTGDLTAPNLMGVNDALKKCAEVIDGLAKKYKLRVVDYYALMNELNKQVQQADPKATIISNDRVHPGSVGHLIMAYQFLKTLGSPQYVGSVEIDNGKLIAAKHAAVTDLNVQDGVVQFKAKEESLPFPVPAEAQPALSLVPFQQELNQQTLKVGGLAAGKYRLTIDGHFIGDFSEEEFAKGLNLAGMESTPQYKQALNVMQKALQYRNVQRKIRDLKFVEFSYLPENLWKAGLPEIQKFIDGWMLFLQSSNDPRHPNLVPVFDAYLKNKPSQKALELEAAALPDAIYVAAQPAEHVYRIEKQKG